VTVPPWLTLGSVARLARGLVWLELALCAGAVIYLGPHLAVDVFTGSPPALPLQIAASCASASGLPCRASMTELYKGRYRIVTDAATDHLTLNLSPPAEFSRPRALLVRLSSPSAVRLAFRSGEELLSAGAPVRLAGSAVRTVTELPAMPGLTALTLIAEEGAEPAPFVLDEVGLFADDRGLLSDARPLFAWIPPARFYGTLIPRAIARLCVFSVVAAFLVPAGILRKINPVLVGLICGAFCLLDLAILFSPYGTHDLRLFYAAGPLQETPGSNLNVGLWQGFRMLQGDGLTFAAGAVPWSRMPGYGLFCALAGALFGHRSLLDLAIGVVLLQLLFYTVAVAGLVWAAGLLWPPHAVFTVGLLVALLPKQLGSTQGDSIIAPIALLLTAALCLCLKPSRDDVPVGLMVLVHLAFAAWFAVRPDVLPGWLVVSLALHWRDRRRLLIPAVLFLAIGLTWGIYKMRYTHEFSLTTSSVGASLVCGLWEAPNRFATTCSDGQYFDWIVQHTGFEPRSKRASDFAVRQVLRFWVTFPGHLAVMLDHKLMQCLDHQCWPGARTFLQEALFYLVMWPQRVMLGLVTIIALCLAAGHERRRTLLLSWPVVLNAPLFWVMFASEGRFYSAIPIALLAAGVPPLFEPCFYARLAARPWHTLTVITSAAGLAAVAWPFHDWLMRADRLHYWAPLLDPSRSALIAFR